MPSWLSPWSGLLLALSAGRRPTVLVEIPPVPCDHSRHIGPLQGNTRVKEFTIDKSRLSLVIRF